jgi:alpha-beta hydrolase superfamily lysophospholipase
MNRIAFLLLILCLVITGAVFAQKKSTEISLLTTKGSLSGTLLPAGRKQTVALIIAGSGPTDRDGNNYLGVKANSYKLVAEGLAQKGIASLRYDKRAVGKSISLGMKEADLRFDDYIHDVKSWINYLIDSAEYKKVVLIGHSEGALLASIAGQDDRVDGVVLVSGMGRSFDEVIAEQISRSAPLAIQQESQTIMDSLKAGKLVSEVPSYFNALYRPSVQPYLISLLRYDPLAQASMLQKPVLILQGDADSQIQVKDAKALAGVVKQAQMVIISKMDHVLKEVLDAKKPMANYSNAEGPLAPGFMKTVTQFIKGLK